MAGVHLGAALSQIHRLFDEGTLAGLPDGRLLERYVVERDELAFETLVKRHGRMVTAVCRGSCRTPTTQMMRSRRRFCCWRQGQDALGG